MINQGDPRMSTEKLPHKMGNKPNIIQSDKRKKVNK